MEYIRTTRNGAHPEVDNPNIVEQIRELQDRVHQLVRATGSIEPTIEMPNTVADHVRSILELRARRQLLFNDSLFRGPAWEMLLELYDLKSRGRREYVSGLCVASGAPTTTALRWINHLESNGWLTRAPDPKDGRRCLVDVTDKTIDSVNRLFRKSDGNRPDGAARDNVVGSSRAAETGTLMMAP
jgi:DNA-binding MarR family transcriptional regulator